jgi:hypothetical protein
MAAASAPEAVLLDDTSIERARWRPPLELVLNNKSLIRSMRRFFALDFRAKFPAEKMGATPARER